MTRSIRILVFLLFAVASVPAFPQTGGDALRVTYDQFGRRVVTHEFLPPAEPCSDCSRISPSPTIMPPPKVSPDLAKRLALMADDEIISVVVSLPEDVAMPVFPSLREDLPDTAPENVLILKRRSDIAAQLLATRLVLNRDRETQLKGAGMTVRDRFWISNSVLADATPAAIRLAAALPDVIHVELNETGIPPPTVLQGRQDIRSDTIFDMATYSLTYMRTALLDTGMPMHSDGTKTHLLFSGLSSMAAYDCVNTTDANCTVAGPVICIGDWG
jgi:hypothetical protein